ncbi:MULTISPECIES: ATP-binding protein [unclassified Methanoregula]|uniref:ATP-binding protein n=1 Tax=unclassified Methanoregula TaxID=2649730 RepID=UPI0009CDD6DF|nr:MULTISPECIES: ATP-binding protein [unclassified Methanoregula]OPX61654.1 MAG: VCP-like ATPase [Methanoregula sp. PtaB.Bin085]OPY34037.1 MAG: VCP-like ATPase [Methanoregula sp. PtaU1.Bin006]
MTGDSDALQIMEVVLTAEIFNQNTDLDINDLTPACREIFSITTAADVKRPVFVSDGLIKRTLGIPDAHNKVSANPFISYEEFGQRLRITALAPAAQWFIKQGGKGFVARNPTLACYYEGIDSTGISYRSVRAANPRFEDTKTYLDTRISKLVGEDEKLRGALDLVIVLAPEEVEQRMEDLVCTTDQMAIINKIEHAIAHRDFLRQHRIYEVGKLLFVGPPGTGKTSLALAMSNTMHMPILEVRLSMITSQFLGETSKNIDRIFELAKKISPAILFIDEFDFVAKSRVADDHGAMKRAVNSLLKNIDKMNLVKHGVVLIGATNHPQLLDEAAWRRFDEVVEFSLPDEDMRKNILRKVTGSLHCTIDYQRLAAQTEGFSGSDIRMMVKEAILSALMDKRENISAEDIDKGIRMVKNREAIRNLNWL